MYAADYREAARNALRGKWKKMALLILLAGLLGAVVGASGGVSIGGFETDLPAEQVQQIDKGVLMVISTAMVAYGLLCTFVGSWVQVGLQALGCRVMDGEEPRAAMLFPKGVYRKALLMNILRGVFIALWSLLFIVPGIMAAYGYAMADYILYTHPEMRAMDALRESKRLMNGRKGRLFCLDLSFIGWELLCTVPMYVLVLPAALITVFVMPDNPMLVAVAMVLGVIAMGIGHLFVQTYRHMAFVAFYRNADRCGEWQDQFAEEEPSAEGEGTEGEASYGSAYHTTALTADETVAKDVFWQHGCSRKRLEQENLLEEYEQMGVSPFAELRWLREYANMLMQRFDREPAALDEILNLSAEYGMDDLLSRALERIERHIRQETLPAEEILNMAGHLLALVVSGVFDGQPGYVQRKREQVGDIADRMEHRLQQSDPEGEWQNALRLVRSMCGQN